MASRRDDDATLVEAAKAGDQQAFTLLFERWFDRSYDVAWRIVRNRDTAAEVAQDAMLASWQGLETLRDPSAFGGWVLRTARNKALNRLKKDGRSPLLDAEDAIDVRGAEAPTPDVGIGVADAERDDLVWAAAAALGERDASLLDLHLRHGLDAAELGEALGVTTNNAHQLLFRLKKKLATGIRAWVLWHGGRPRCAELAGVLAAAGATSFDAATAKLVERHADGCPVCEERRAAVLAPEAMFAAVPLLPAPLLVKQQAASALAGLGVPVDPGLVGTLGSAAGDAAGSLASGTGTGADLGTAAGSATDPSGTGAVADGVRDVGADVGAGGADPTTVLDAVHGAGADVAPGAATGAAAMGAPDDDVTARAGGRRRLLAAAGAAAVLLVVLLVILLSGGREDDAALDTAAAGGTDRSSSTVDDQEREELPSTSSTSAPATTAGEVLPPPTLPDTPPSTAGPSVIPPPTTATTTPTTTATTQPTTTTTAPPPEVDRFTSTEQWPAPPGRCPNTLYSLVTLVWDTTGADAASIAGPGVGAGSLPADGSLEVCEATSRTPKPWRWTLTATGPGGTATATTEILAGIG